MQKAFSVANRVYKKLIRYAERKGDISALLEAPVELLPASVCHRQADFPSQLGCSFRSEITSHSRTWYPFPERRDLPEWALDNKLRAYEFMRELGVRTPKIHQSGVVASDLVFRPKTAIKPEEGYLSNGVFLIDEETKALEVKVRRRDLVPADVLKRIEALLAQGLVEKDLWYVEEVVANATHFPPLDIKFFCFYGECHMAMYVSRDPMHDWRFMCLDRRNSPINVKAYPNSSIGSPPVSEDHFRMAESISRQIPTPFLRLDFLLGDEPVFGEIGNLVGNFENFGTEWDRRLGRAFIDARGRLYDDLRRGRAFEVYDRMFTKE